MPANAPDGIVTIHYKDMCSSEASVRAKLNDLLEKVLLTYQAVRHDVRPVFMISCWYSHSHSHL